jgi:radical SAM protein with 4Fe4S-binding SPASM domain
VKEVLGVLAKDLMRKAPKFLGDVVTGKRPITDAKGILEYQLTRRKTLVNLEITSRCNTSCKCCMRDPEILGFPTNLNMSLEQVKQILDSYDPAQVQAVLLGGSESLLHPEFFTILEMIGERFTLSHSDLYTNGIVLAREPDTLGRLAESGIGSVTFSVQGARQETVSRLQPGVSMEGNLASAKYISENSDTSLWVNYVVQEANVDEMLEFVDMIADSGFSGVSFIPYNAIDFADEYDYEAEWKRMNLAERLIEARERATQYGLHMAHASDLCSCGLNMDIVRADGSIQLCPGPSSSKYLIGNVFEEGVAAVSARKRRQLKKVTRALQTGSVPDMCNACAIRSYHVLP